MKNDKLEDHVAHNKNVLASAVALIRETQEKKMEDKIIADTSWVSTINM